MPELPEVQTTVSGLNKKVLKRTFVDVWSDWKKIVKKPKDFEQFKKEIKNKKIKKIWRRAKNIIFDLSPTNFDVKEKKHRQKGKSSKLVGDKSEGPALSGAEGYSLLVHQKMTGHLLIGDWQLLENKWKPIKEGPLNDPYNRFIHLLFFLDGGKMMALSDVRKFAKVELWKTEELLNSKEFKNLGPEPLDNNFTFLKFKETLTLRNTQGKKIKGRTLLRQRLRTGKVKQVLMNPEIIAGIGNIYSSEILWQAKIHPEKNVAKLNEKELKSIYDSIKKVLTLAVKLGGESFSDYRKPDGSKGDFDTERKAYRREGQKCSRCGKKIKRIKLGGRSTFFCPKCQKL